MNSKIQTIIIIIGTIINIILVVLLTELVMVGLLNIPPRFSSRDENINGSKYEASFYNVWICKSGSFKIGVKWSKYECSNNREFIEGYYTNEATAKISKSEFEQLIKMFPIEEIEDMSEATIKDYIFRINNNLLFNICKTNKLSTDNLEIVTKSEEDDYSSCIDKKEYCLIGYYDDTYPIIVPYESGKCKVTEEICADINEKNNIDLDIAFNIKNYCQK